MAKNDERLPSSIQESITTAIALCADDNARAIAAKTDPGFLDPPYSDIAEVCIVYRKEYKHPPGAAHIDDVFGLILDNKDHKEHGHYSRIIEAMLRQAQHLDTRYVLDCLDEFIRVREMRKTLAQSFDRYQKGGPDTVEDIEELFRDQMRRNARPRKNGFKLSDPEALGFLDRDETEYCNLGLGPLDTYGVRPTKRTYFNFLAPRNKGKSQFLGHCGKMAAMKGWRVAHYTLENSAEMTAQRYMQAMFSGVKREGNYHQTVWTQDDRGNITFSQAPLPVEFFIENNEETRRFLENKVKNFRHRLGNIHIREFPTGRLSVDGLQRDLDELDALYGFIPDMVLLDGPQLMQLPKKEKDYSALDSLGVDLRGLAVERDFAFVGTQQGNREAEKAGTVYGHQGGGTMGFQAIADNMLTYSQTAAEEEKCIARLYSQKVRNDRARITVIILQHYDSGQFCLPGGAFLCTKEADKARKNFIGVPEKEDEEDEEDGQKNKYKRRG